MQTLYGNIFSASFTPQHFQPQCTVRVIIWDLIQRNASKTTIVGETMLLLLLS